MAYYVKTNINISYINRSFVFLTICYVERKIVSYLLYKNYKNKTNNNTTTTITTTTATVIIITIIIISIIIIYLSMKHSPEKCTILSLLMHAYIAIYICV